jgi:PAS domain S-box-containing protein
MSERTPSTILCVDDTPDKLELAATILRKAGYQVATAFNGRTALDIARQEIPDLILSDVSMPVMDGIELCRAVRDDEKLRTIPIMLITAFLKDAESMAEGLRAGADDYLEAPYEPQRLIAKVARLIERKRAEEPLARLASIVENCEDAIIGKSLDGTITSWNFGAEKIYGYKAEEIIGQPIYAIVPDNRRDELRGILNGISRGARVNQLQTQRVTKDGRVIDALVTISPIRDASGRVVGASAIARDITERLQGEAERERLIKELQTALAEVKTLRGILPICMHCKKIRDDEGAWRQLEVYIKEHTNADFSHGMCEPCAKKMYPEIYARLSSSGNKEE